MNQVLLVIVSLLVLFVGFSSANRRCNEVVCASVVSKCMLTQACKCELGLDKEKCTCCDNCSKCLGKLYGTCCSCLDMCDETKVEFSPNDSQVGDIEHPFPGLFAALTKIGEPMDDVDGIAISYPAELPVEELSKRLQTQHNMNYKDHSPLLPMPRTGINCTVIFMSQCFSAFKCKEKCDNLGASYYRYFANGCCECVGISCLNYGIAQPKCPKCPSLNDDEYYDIEYISDEPQQSNAIEEDYTP